MAPDQIQGKERRRYIRIRKNYIIRFCEKSNPSLKFEVSQVENISRGGLCFTSTIHFASGTDISIELRTPYVADTIFLEGKVISTRETVKGILYANSLEFHDITPEASEVLQKIEKYNLNRTE